MNGPDHYREAERLLAEAKQSSGVPMPNTIAAAQVHATLALAAATITSPHAENTQSEWHRIVSVSNRA